MSLDRTLRRPKVWVLSELYYPEVTSTGHYMTVIAEHLATDGFDVKVLCGQPTYGARGTRAARRERRGGVQIFRCAGTTFDKDRLLGRLLNTATLSASTWWTGLRQIRRGDVIVAVTNPPTMPWIAGVVARLRRATFVPLFHDVLPVVLEVAGGRHPGSVGVRLARRLTSFVMRNAARVVVVGRPLVDELARYGHSDEIVVIPNWSDDQLVEPVDPCDSLLRRALGLVDARVALYAGTFGRANDLDTVIGAAEILAKRSDIVVVMCGDGPRRAWVEDAVVARGLTNLVVTGPYDRDQQSDMYAIGDVVIVPLLAGMGRSSMPSRTYNALAAGRPIVAVTEASSELALLVSEHEVGVVVAPGDAEELAIAIDQLVDDPRCADIATAARAVAAGPCSTATAMRAWSAFVRSVVELRP